MDRRLKKEYHWFTLTDYEQEENFLRKKHNAGYKLVKVTMLGTYYFEKCKPEDVVYKLDFNPQKPDDRESYLKMFEDYGWEYIQDLNEYSYFRKPASEKAFADTEDLDEVDVAGGGNDDIFSDNESRLEMMKRIFMKKMIPILIVFAALVIPQLLLAMHHGSGSGAGLVILIMWAVLFAVYVLLIVRCGLGFRRLGQKYKNKKD